MSEQLPEQIDPFRLVRQKRILIGSLPLRRMERLVPLLQSDDGAAQVELEFGTDDMQVRFLRGKVRADLAMTCQRCMQPMTYTVQTELALGLVADKREADALPAHYEPLIVEAVPMPLLNIIEDELLLSLPIVAAHPDDVCPARGRFEAVRPDVPQKQNPFSVLAKLKTGADRKKE